MVSQIIGVLVLLGLLSNNQQVYGLDEYPSYSSNMREESSFSLPKNLPYPGNTLDTELLAKNRAALQNIPSVVNDFLDELNAQGVENPEERLQILTPVTCVDRKEALCYHLQRPFTQHIEGRRTNIRATLRLPNSWKGQEVTLFALERNSFGELIRGVEMARATFPDAEWSSSSPLFHLRTCSRKENDRAHLRGGIKSLILECDSCKMQSKVEDLAGDDASAISDQPSVGRELVLMTSPCHAEGHISKRSIELSPESICQQGDTSCCVHPYQLDQSLSRIGRIYFKPENIVMNICQGHCNDPSTARSHRMSFINAIHMHVPHDLRKLLLSQQCCSPLRYRPLTIMYHDHETRLQIKVLSNFTVVECGCH